jgi:hypothetical protein
VLLAIADVLTSLILIRAFSLDRNQAMAVLMFGFLIDLDHLFGMAEYVSQDQGANLLSIRHAMAADVEWKSLMHQPVTFVIVAPVALLFTYALPLLAWALHLLMDFVQTSYLGVASIPEMALTVVLMAAVIANEVQLFRQATDGPATFRAFLSWGAGRVVGEVKRWLPLPSKKAPTDPGLR